MYDVHGYTNNIITQERTPLLFPLYYGKVSKFTNLGKAKRFLFYVYDGFSIARANIRII